MKRFLLSLTLILSSALLASESKDSLRIIEIENRSSDVVKVDQIMVKKLKKVALLKKLEVPFVSWIKNALYRSAEILGKPFIPAEALRILVGSEEWGLWRDERGIVYARRYQQGKNSPSNCVAELKKVAAFKLILTITQNGSLAIQEK